MRIIGGALKGKNIIAPSDLPSRPTTDFAKEALFNILSNKIDIENSKILDLYCGTGNISYEFASRGALKVISIDESYACISFLKNTSKKLLLNTIHPFKSEVLQYLKKSDDVFAVIFADPPFDYADYTLLLEIIFSKKLLTHDGLFILEYSSRLDLSDHPFCFDTRKYGAIKFSFFSSDISKND